jgi:quercetin dioxygenase-like cupin family protein
MRRSGIALALLLSAVALPAYAADAPAPERKVLMTEPLTGSPDKQVVLVDVTWPPGSALGWHTHPGDEYATVVAGEFKLRSEGGAWKTYKTGESFHNNAGVVHEAKNDGTVPARTIQTYVVAKDQPVATMKK